MKKLNLKQIVLSILLTSLIVQGPTAHANDMITSIFKNVLNTAQKTLEEANKKREELERKRLENEKRRAEEEKVRAEEERARAEAIANAPDTSINNSIYHISGVVDTSVKWIMYSIEKGNFKEVVTVAASNGRYANNVSLRDGAGTYKISVFKSSTERFNSPYSFVTTIKVENLDERDMSFLLPSEQVQSDNAEIVSLMKELTQNATSKADGVKKIHDYITQTVKYDFVSYQDGTFANKEYDALTVLRKPLTVCSGYSSLFAALLRAYGLRAKIVHGKAVVAGGFEDHAWNEVQLNGEWKIIDSTWNTTLKSSKYYFISEEDFTETHQKEKDMVEY